MGLQTGLLDYLSQPKRVLRVIVKMSVLIFRAILQSILKFKKYENTNVREYDSGVAQPKYFNSFNDIGIIHFLKSVQWVRDLSPNLEKDADFDVMFNQFEYDEIVKAYNPTKNNTMEALNIERSWRHSYFNKFNSNRGDDFSESIQIYRRNDVLFSDMIVNAQGIYKVKQVKQNSVQHEKVKLFFGPLLKKYHKVFEVHNENQAVDKLVADGKLYFLDYPIMREIQMDRPANERYKNTKKSTSGQVFQAFIQIPFAIFCEIDNYIDNQKHFVCVASVFNDTFYKKKPEQIQQQQIFHCLSNNILDRDRWEMAKNHIVSVDTNDFTIRIHLGYLHFGSSIYTSALTNLANKYNLKWLRDEFLDVFSSGLLQVNFMGNYTLIDKGDALLGKIFYVSREQIAQIIVKSNNKLNILQFDPENLGKDCYHSQSIKMTQMYYQKLEYYVNYLFRKYEKDFQGRQKQYSKYVFDELYVKQLQISPAFKNFKQANETKLDGMPGSFSSEPDIQKFKRMLINLAYIWTIVHAQTFSLLSVSCTFYNNPPLMTKPLSFFKKIKNPLSEIQKRSFLPPKQGIKDSLTLHKVVTYRQDNQSIISRWNDLPSTKETNSFWEKVQNEKEFRRNFKDYWIDLAEEVNEINFHRAKKGLYYLHWFMPHEIPMSLNI